MHCRSFQQFRQSREADQRQRQLLRYARQAGASLTSLPIMPRVQVRHLFISPGHNYVGHHGQPPDTHPILEVDAVECVAGRGIRGDRFFDYKPDYKGQITFFAWEVLEALHHDLQLPEIQPAATRRNVITQGMDLIPLIGVEFEIQGLRFQGTEECRPCYWMNNSFRDERAELWLNGKGGLRARILTSGWLRRDA